MKYEKEIETYINSHFDEMTELLRELVAVRSVMSEPEDNMPFGKEPARALDMMLKKCSEFGFITENAENYAGSADISDNEPELAILCHLDVVPENPGWHSNPYELTYDENSGKLLGRGTSDDKGPAAAAVFAMRAVKELGIPLKKGVRIIFGTNEENGSADLAYYMKTRKMPPLVFTPDGNYPVINIEKGMIRLNITCPTDESRQIKYISGGSVINAVAGSAEAEISGITAADISAEYGGASVEFTEKNGVFHITVHGKTAHASSPENGVNAVTALIGLLSEMPLEDSRGIRSLRALAQLFPCGETDGSSCSLACRDDESGALTLVLSVLETKNNIFSAKADIRFPLCTSCGEIIKKITDTLESHGLSVEVLMQDEPHCTDGNSPFVRTLLNVYESVTGLKGECLAIGGGTYVHHIDGGVAFGAVFPDEDVNMHGADEFITAEHFKKNAIIMAHAIAELCS